MVYENIIKGANEIYKSANFVKLGGYEYNTETESYFKMRDFIRESQGYEKLGGAPRVCQLELSLTKKLKLRLDEKKEKVNLENLENYAIDLGYMGTSNKIKILDWLIKYHLRK